MHEIDEDIARRLDRPIPPDPERPNAVSADKMLLGAIDALRRGKKPNELTKQEWLLLTNAVQLSPTYPEYQHVLDQMLARLDPGRRQPEALPA